MKHFKVGDKVRIIKSNTSNCESEIGKVGTITEALDETMYLYYYKIEGVNAWWQDEELEPVNAAINNYTVI